MKKLLALILALCFTLGLVVPVNASGGVTVGEFQPKSFWYVINGTLPRFSGIEDEARSALANGAVEKFFEHVMSGAGTTTAWYPAVTFSYELFQYGEYISVLMRGEVAGKPEQLFDTLVLNAADGSFASIRVILGDNGIKLAQRVVTAEMSAYPENYLKNAQIPVVSDSTEFYVDNGGSLVMIFEKNKITAAYAGTPRFVIPLKSVSSVTLTAELSYFSEGMRMIPLRQALEPLGFEVGWTGEAATLTLGGVKHIVTPGSKNFAGAELPVAPEMSGGIVYVPVLLAERYCGALVLAKPEVVVITKLQTDGVSSVIEGRVVESAAGGRVKLKVADGRELVFDIKNADGTSRAGVVTAGADVKLRYVGNIQNTDTSGVAVLGITPPPGSVRGKVLEADAVTLVISTDKGDVLRFKISEADKSRAGAMAKGSYLTVFYLGTVKGEAVNAEVTRIAE